MKLDFEREIESWKLKLSKRNFSECKSISIKCIEDCKQTLANRENNKEELNNFAYYYGVLFKGLYEFIRIGEITTSKDWNKENKNYEELWRLKCNCIDRFNFCRSLNNFSLLDHLFERLDELKSQFTKFFGNGLYSSPDILIKKEVCSICSSNIKGCDHIPGNLYNGTLCYAIPKEFDMISISLVQTPKDLRCRVWPWNFTDEFTFSTAIMTFFMIDDWLNENLIS